MLEFNDKPRPLVAGMLDAAVILLRHNLHKKLDAEAYM
jgi:hypothetical protein